MNVRIEETWDQYLKRRYPGMAQEIDRLMSVKVPASFADHMDKQARIRVEESHEG